uniref:Mucin-1 n=1 Tax=Sus scrofa TaxID=9823 RepID=A0A8D0Q367_PIG
MSSPTTSPASGLVTTPVHVGTSTPATSPASSSTVTPTHMGTSSKATMSPVSKGTLSSVPSNHSDTPTTLASHITRTIANSTNRSIVPPTSSHPKTSQQSSVMVSLIFLYFRITNLQFTSSLEDPSTSYYKDLQRRISELAVCQCRRKNCGQLDIFPTRDAYHPMSEYPTYHTHGRYVPPGSTKRNPYEQVSAGNGGGSLSYSNLAATSANL